MTDTLRLLLNRALAKCTPWSLGDFMGLFYLQVSRDSLTEVLESDSHGEERKSTCFPFHYAHTMAVSLPGLSPETSYSIANVTLTKALPVRPYWILSHSWDVSFKAKLDDNAVLCRVWKSDFTFVWSET